jgi:hypothetical protein
MKTSFFYDNRRGPDKISIKQFFVYPTGFSGTPSLVDVNGIEISIYCVGKAAGSDQTIFRMGLKTLDLPLEFLRLPEIIGIQKSDIFALRDFKAAVSGARYPPVFFISITYLIPVYLQNFTGIISRTIINHNDFIIPISLLED